LFARGYGKVHSAGKPFDVVVLVVISTVIYLGSSSTDTGNDAEITTNGVAALTYVDTVSFPHE
jgi:hypothetical protein